MRIDLGLLSHRLVLTFVLVLGLAGVVYIARGDSTMVLAGGAAFVVLTSGVWMLGAARARMHKRSGRLAKDPKALVSTTREYVHHVVDVFDERALARIRRATQAIIVGTLEHIRKGVYKNDREAARQLNLMSDSEFQNARDPRKIALTLAHLYYLGHAAGGQTADDVTALVDNLIAGIKDKNL